MKKLLVLLLATLISLPVMMIQQHPLLAAPNNTIIDGLFVVSQESQSEITENNKLSFVDGTFAFDTNGTYPTINENLNNGFEVLITSGGGDLLLTGTQTANLRINNGNSQVNIINGQFTKSLYLDNTIVHLINTHIDIQGSYAIEVNSHVRLHIDNQSYVNATSSYTSTIMINQNKTDIQLTIDGIVETNQQAVGIDSGSIVDRIEVNGTLKSNANYGLITAIGAEVKDVIFSPTSHAINPLGIAVFSVNSQSKIDKVTYNGTSDTRVLLTLGITNNPAMVGDVVFNGDATVRGGAFYINGTLNSLVLTPVSSIDQTINTYGLLYTNNNTTIGKYHVLGHVATTYIIADSYATSHMLDVVIDPASFNTNSFIPLLSMAWITGHIDSLYVSPAVFEVLAINRPFNFRTSAVVDRLVIDQSIIDTKTQGPGEVFNFVVPATIKDLQLIDPLLFGDSTNTNINNLPYTHIEPTILTSNETNNLGVVTFDIEIPELTPLTNFSTQGIKLTYLFDDYTHSNDFMYYGGVLNVTVPDSIASSGKTFVIANYAKLDTTDEILFTSNRSQSKLIDTYELSFNLNGGDGVAPVSQQLVEGALADSVITPTKLGYRFDGWNTLQDGSGEMWDFSTSRMPANNVVLYAKWQEEFQLSFDLNGGEGNAPITQNLILGELAQVVGTPLKTGHTFNGWNTSADGTGTTWDFATTTMPANDVTLYAQWTVNQYVLSFDLNQGTSSVIPNQSINFNELAMPVTSPTRTGYTFNGWNTSADGTGTTWDFATTTMPASNVTLYAQWEAVVPVTYQLSFNLNGGSGDIPSQTVMVGALAAQPTNPTRAGYTFKEWNTSIDGKGTTWNFNTMTMPANDITLYAQWTKANNNLPDTGVSGDVYIIASPIILLGSYFLLMKKKQM